MRLRISTLCDAANTREGLVSILSGGITVTRRPRFPAPMGLSLALLLEATQEDTGKDYELKVIVAAPDSPDLLARIEAGFTVDIGDDEDFKAGVPISIPLAANLDTVLLPSPGLYVVTVFVNDEVIDVLPFMAHREALPNTPEA